MTKWIYHSWTGAVGRTHYTLRSVRMEMARFRNLQAMSITSKHEEIILLYHCSHQDKISEGFYIFLSGRGGWDLIWCIKPYNKKKLCLKPWWTCRHSTVLVRPLGAAPEWRNWAHQSVGGGRRESTSDWGAGVKQPMMVGFVKIVKAFYLILFYHFNLKIFRYLLEHENMPWSSRCCHEHGNSEVKGLLF